MTDSKKIDDGEPTFSRHEEMIDAICNAVILGEDEDYRPVHLEPREAEAALRAAKVRWRPIAEADNDIAYVHDIGVMRIGCSYPIWVREEDGRVYEAFWSDNGQKAYWWDIEGESPVDPIEFMPHPLDPRFATFPEAKDNADA